MCTIVFDGLNFFKLTTILDLGLARKLRFRALYFRLNFLGLDAYLLKSGLGFYLRKKSQAGKPSQKPRPGRA
jgi:hypothetical protein